MTSSSAVECRSSGLDVLDLGIDASSVEPFMELAAQGVIGPGVNGGAVQDDFALHPDTRITLGGGTEERDGDIVVPDEDDGKGGNPSPGH